jgi:hypothetical protein
MVEKISRRWTLPEAHQVKLERAEDKRGVPSVRDVQRRHPDSGIASPTQIVRKLI